MYTDKKWLAEQCLSKTVREIAQECGVSVVTIRSWKRRFNLKTEVKRCRLNSSYFKQINTAEKSYWLGFLAADGCVENGRNKRVSLVLSEKDKTHVEMFRRCVGSTHKIVYIPASTTTIRGREYRCSAAYGVFIYSKEMVFDLITHGIIPAKTHNLKPPKVPKKFVRDWVRGYFDGDGTISVTSSGQRAGNVIGTKSVVNFIHTTCPVFGRPYRSRYNVWVSAFSGNGNAAKLSTYLYERASLCLERKRQKMVKY